VRNTTIEDSRRPDGQIASDARGLNNHDAFNAALTPGQIISAIGVFEEGQRAMNAEIRES